LVTVTLAALVAFRLSITVCLANQMTTSVATTRTTLITTLNTAMRTSLPGATRSATGWCRACVARAKREQARRRREALAAAVYRVPAIVELVPCCGGEDDRDFACWARNLRPRRNAAVNGLS